MSTKLVQLGIYLTSFTRKLSEALRLANWNSNTFILWQKSVSDKGVPFGYSNLWFQKQKHIFMYLKPIFCFDSFAHFDTRTYVFEFVSNFR